MKKIYYSELNFDYRCMHGQLLFVEIKFCLLLFVFLSLSINLLNWCKAVIRFVGPRGQNYNPFFKLFANHFKIYKETPY